MAEKVSNTNKAKEVSNMSKAEKEARLLRAISRNRFAIYIPKSSACFYIIAGNRPDKKIAKVTPSENNVTELGGNRGNKLPQRVDALFQELEKVGFTVVRNSANSGIGADIGGVYRRRNLAARF